MIYILGTATTRDKATQNRNKLFWPEHSETPFAYSRTREEWASIYGCSAFDDWEGTPVDINGIKIKGRFEKAKPPRLIKTYMEAATTVLMLLEVDGFRMPREVRRENDTREDTHSIAKHFSQCARSTELTQYKAEKLIALHILDTLNKLEMNRQKQTDKN